jgi:hypothetical protein
MAAPAAFQRVRALFDQLDSQQLEPEQPGSHERVNHHVTLLGGTPGPSVPAHRPGPTAGARTAPGLRPGRVGLSRRPVWTGPALIACTSGYAELPEAPFRLARAAPPNGA